MELSSWLERLVRIAGGRRRPVVYAYNLVRLPISRFWDPDVPYRYGSRVLRIPLSHDLPVIRVLGPRYGHPLELVVEAVGPGAMVDVGANIGDTAAVMLDHGATAVLAIEPSPKFRRLLSENVPEAVVISALVGPAGSGRVVEEHRGTASTVRGKGEQMRRLSSVLPPAFATPVLVKVDTDGMDQAIVLADLDWLAQSRPTLFVEYSPDLTRDGAGDFFNVMRGLGYGYLLWYDEQGRFLASTSPVETRVVDDLAGHFRGGGNRHYADIAMFTEEALWSVVRDRSMERL